MPPFQNEGAERRRGPAKQPQQALKPKPFSEEADEKRPPKAKVRKLQQASKAFGDEAYEQSDSDSSSEVTYQGQGTSTFALGWETLKNFGKATAWSKHTKEIESANAASKKRAYNNSSRAAAAMKKGSKKRKHVFSARGADPARVSELCQKKCKCALSCLLQLHVSELLSIEKGQKIDWGANGICFSQFKQKELIAFLKEFWQLTKPEQDHLVWNLGGTSIICLFTPPTLLSYVTLWSELSTAFMGDGTVRSWSISGLDVKNRGCAALEL